MKDRGCPKNSGAFRLLKVLVAVIAVSFLAGVVGRGYVLVRSQRESTRCLDEVQKVEEIFSRQRADLLAVPVESSPE